MKIKSLKNRLAVAMSVLVIGSGLVISALVAHRYSQNLLEATVVQGENLAHALALEATDKILVNDLVVLQKMLTHQMQSNPTLAYLFIVRGDRVLAHTFTKGVPVELVAANNMGQNHSANLSHILSTAGKRYLDIAWPILSGDAGVLRVGISQEPYDSQISRVWMQISLFTLGFLAVALVIGFFVIRRYTQPLSNLARAAEDADLSAKEACKSGQDEIEKLTQSFSRMMGRMEEHNRLLAEKTDELERSYDQIRKYFEVVREMGAQPDLESAGTYLLQQFRSVLRCDRLALAVTNEEGRSVWVCSEGGVVELEESSAQAAVTVLGGVGGGLSFLPPRAFSPWSVKQMFPGAGRLGILPIWHEKRLLGAMIIGCPGNCPCEPMELEVAELTLKHCAGAIRRAVVQEEESRGFRRRLDCKEAYCGIVGKDPKMQILFKLIEETAPTDATVLIEGESGTGKELVAAAIHSRSTRKDRPFVVINCSAYPATLLEAELFGHEKGAFTGATHRKAGRFEQADGGTVFLDEAGEIPLSAQVRLLRVLQTRRFERIGGDRTLDVDVRIIAATNKDLLAEVKGGRFREDLYYRLHVIPVHLPPLADRRHDILLLARHFLNKYADTQGKEVRDFSPQALRMLQGYRWPGNVRELENSVEHAVVLCRGRRIEVSDFPAWLLDAAFAGRASSKSDALQDSQHKLLVSVLESCGWNKTRAAEQLGISRSTLYAKIKKFRIPSP